MSENKIEEGQRVQISAVASNLLRNIDVKTQMLNNLLSNPVPRVYFFGLYSKYDHDVDQLMKLVDNIISMERQARNEIKKEYPCIRKIGDFDNVDSSVLVIECHE
jgi:hypothetical protein